jgi:CheY-like chemotaxis protein/predicted regulator of Ras-like GTPase activity (Roadblock/LC7/MglB family)
VDDEEDLTWSISKHLSKDKDKYGLITVNSAPEALEVLSQLPIELVISDVRMPEMSGLDLLLQIKENYPVTKVIIMTAYGSSEVQQEANRRGCLRYIEKPFEIQELRQLILDTVEEKKGFDGRLSDFQLSDLIQMNCLGRLTNAIFVENDDDRGIIYFEDGNIVHTEVDRLKGEAAFYEILSWQGGNFSIKKGLKAPEETIIKGWQSLLLEGLRRADEQRNPAVQEEMKIKAKQSRIRSFLEKISVVKGVLFLAIIDREGFSLSSLVTEDFKDKIDVSALSPVVSALIKQIETVVEEVEMEKVKEVTIELTQGILKLNRIHEREEYLVTLADQRSNLSLLRMETKKHLKSLATEL